MGFVSQNSDGFKITTEWVATVDLTKTGDLIKMKTTVDTPTIWVFLGGWESVDGIFFTVEYYVAFNGGFTMILKGKPIQGERETAPSTPFNASELTNKPEDSL
jgi:hypothetical protein